MLVLGSLHDELKPAELELCKKIQQGDADLADHPELQDILLQYYWDEMPYGAKKARTLDPTVWLTEQLCKEKL
jgi:hypothetical protein